MIKSLIVTIFYILIGFFLLDLMVVIHELGHYFLARLFGIDIDCFQLGFGPEIKKVRRGITCFSFAAIPFGGLCRFDNLSLYSVHPFKRILLYLAGPVANAMTALIVFTIYVGVTNHSFFSSVSLSLQQCVSEVKMFYSAICSVLSGRAKIGDVLSGALTASRNIGQLTASGFGNGLVSGLKMSFYLFASVSLSLGAANLLPVPALDGGYILIGLIELMTKRTFSEKFYLIVQIVGVVLLLVIFPVVRQL